MGKNKPIKFLLFLAIFLAKALYADGKFLTPATTTTNGDNAPAVGVNNGNFETNYTTQITKVYRERLGKKIVIKKLYLYPAGTATEKYWGSAETGEPYKNGLYEAAFIYLEVQSIWPEPVLLTAGKISVYPISKVIHLRAGMIGELSPQITAISNPQRFLLQPGEVKLIALSQGITLDGVLDFFKGEVSNDFIFEDLTPIINSNNGRVSEFNAFLRKRYGKKTFVRIELFEKDYQPLLVSDVYLGSGSDLFAHGDLSTNTYQFGHDIFMGEILHQLRNGK